MSASLERCLRSTPSWGQRPIDIIHLHSEIAQIQKLTGVGSSPSSSLLVRILHLHQWNAIFRGKIRPILLRNRRFIWSIKAKLFMGVMNPCDSKPEMILPFKMNHFK